MMKKIYWLLFMVGLLSSCSSTLEDRARKQMYKTLANEFKYADNFEITNENIIYCKDSVFIMLFHMKGNKDNGDAIEGDLEYAYEERSMWAYDHPEVRVWNDYFREITPFSKNSVELYLKDMKDMTEKGQSMLFKTPYSIAYSVIFAVGRKIPSEFSQKVKEFKKEKK